MADNITLNTGSGGAVLATDDIGPGVHYQIIKVAYGALDSVTLVGPSNGLPVNLVNDWLSLVDDAAFTPATSRVMPVGFEFDDATPDSVNEGDVGAARMSANRNIYVNIRDNAGNERGLNVDAAGAIAVTDGGGSLTIDGTVAISGTVTVASHAVTNAGTFAVQAVAAGDVAHDGADSGNPVKVGAVARTTNPTAVADGDRVNAYADDLGRLVNYPFAPRDRIAKGSRISLTSTTETTLIAAGGAGIFRDLIWVICSNESATEVRVDFRDVAAGTVLFSIDLAADGGGAVVAMPVVWPQATANSAWTAQLSAAVSTVYISGLAVENN